MATRTGRALRSRQLVRLWGAPTCRWASGAPGADELPVGMHAARPVRSSSERDAALAWGWWDQATVACVAIEGLSAGLTGRERSEKTWSSLIGSPAHVPIPRFPSTLS